MKYFIISITLFASLSLYSQKATSINFEKLEQLHNDMKFDSITKLDDYEFISEFESKTGEILEIYADSFEALNRDDKAFDYLKKAKRYYNRNKDLENVAKINAKVWHLLNSQKNLELDQDLYLKELKSYAQKTNSQKWLMLYYNIKGIDNFEDKTKDSAKIYFLKAIKIAENLDSLSSQYNININLGALHLVEYENPDSAIYYYEKALKSYKKNNTNKEDVIFALYNNLGNAYRDQKKYKEALSYYKLAEDINLKLHDKMSKRILFSNMDATYYYMNDWKNAYDYLYKYDSINQLLEIKEQNTNITDIEEKYQNEKLRADNLEIESKSLQNRNIAYGLGGSLVLGSIIVFLIYKNNLRNQEIEKQEQLIRNEKLTNQLKEQELISINAMIAGQEKERLRIANDLHDDLGSLMATIKMHFGSLKGKSSTDLYKRTNTLIEEAYQKIRNIAHAKNSGVLAKQGFLKAVKQLAKSVSNSEKIQIKVYENDLNHRLENSLEITLFRIVQELITNVIKHAEATEVDIHLNQDDNTLNIMVEDNGKGFDSSQITKNKTGIGLTSIERRIENLDGKMIIESQLNSGTSVIIELPL